MMTYESIKSLTIDQMHTAHNVSFAGVNEVLFDSSNANEVKDVLVQKVDIKYFENGAGQYRITNQSVIEFENHYPGYEWTYEDNSVSYGVLPNRDFNEGELVNLRIVKTDNPIFSGGPGTTFKNVDIITTRASRCDWTPEQVVTITKITNNQFMFLIDDEFWGPQGVNNRYYTIKFPEEDNIEHTGNPLFFKSFSGFPRAVRVELCYHFGPEPGYPEDITCCFELEIFVGECEETGENKIKRDFPISNGETVKMDGLIWVETSGALDWATPGEVGARTKVRGGGDLKCTVSLRGKYVDKEEDCEIYEVDLTEWNITDDQLSINLDHEDARKFPGGIESKHTFEFNGEIFELPVGNDWLILD